MFVSYSFLCLCDQTPYDHLKWLLSFIFFTWFAHIPLTLACLTKCVSYSTYKIEKKIWSYVETRYDHKHNRYKTYAKQDRKTCSVVTTPKLYLHQLHQYKKFYCTIITMV